MSELIRVTEKELSLVDGNVLSPQQLQQLLKKTPAKYVKERPGKGGGKWKYVEGAYVRKVLNLMFGWDWDFEIVDQIIEHGEVVVKGRLTARVGDRKIVKMQFGNKDIICKKGTDTPLSIGNDLKAAATDALKKCAVEIGIASDVYTDIFMEAEVSETTIEEIEQRFQEVEHLLDNETKTYALRIIENKEQTSYNKLWNKLRQY